MLSKISNVFLVALVAALLVASVAVAGPRSSSLGSIGIEIDPRTGHGNVTFGQLIGGDEQSAIVNDFFDLTGVSCIDCGEGLCEAGQPRTVVVNFEQNGLAAGVLDFGLTNVTVNFANGPIAQNVSCVPGATCSPSVVTGAAVTAEITVELTGCNKFRVFFDLEGSELEAPADGTCPCYSTSDLAEVDFQEPLACVNAVNGPFPFWGMATDPIPSVPPFAVVVFGSGAIPDSCTNLDAAGSFQPVDGQQFRDCACSVLYNASLRGVACGPLPPNVDCSTENVAPVTPTSRPIRHGGQVPDRFFF